MFLSSLCLKSHKFYSSLVMIIRAVSVLCPLHDIFTRHNHQGWEIVVRSLLVTVKIKQTSPSIFSHIFRPVRTSPVLFLLMETASNLVPHDVHISETSPTVVGHNFRDILVVSSRICCNRKRLKVYKLRTYQHRRVDTHFSIDR